MPAEITVIQNKDILKDNYLLLLELIKRKESAAFHSDWIHKKNVSAVHVIFSDMSMSKKKTLLEKLEKLYLPSSQFASYYFSEHDVNYFGLIVFSEEKQRQSLFLTTIQTFIESYK